jgi:centrin-2
MRECFNALDEDGSGAIGIDELEGPLIGLGFYNTRQEISDMLDEIDDDGSGEIEFKEFLLILKSSSNSSQDTSLIKQFFKDLSSGQIGK